MASRSSVDKRLSCPICGGQAADAYKPFCSKRCADIDLARWFTGSYAISGREEDEGDGAAPPEPRSGPETDDEQA